MRKMSENTLAMSHDLLVQLEKLLIETDFTGREINLAEIVAYMNHVKRTMKHRYETSGGQPEILKQILHMDVLINYARNLQTNNVASM